MLNQFPSRGFTLIESAIATAVLITAIAGLAQLFALSARFTRDVNRSAVALVAAQDKLEMLGALRFGYDDTGAPTTDARLRVSPLTSLHENVDSWCEWLTGDGRVSIERDATYLRRWRVRPIATSEPAAIAIDVCVYHADRRNSGPDDAAACLGSVRVRQP